MTRAALTPEQRRQRREDRAQRAHEAEQRAAEHRGRLDAARDLALGATRGVGAAAPMRALALATLSSVRVARGEAAEEAAQRPAEHREAPHAARAIVAAGRCPLCGAPLRRNTSVAGWWQCAQSGAPQWRERPADPPCGWQTFTE